MAASCRPTAAARRATPGERPAETGGGAWDAALQRRVVLGRRGREIAGGGGRRGRLHGAGGRRSARSGRCCCGC